MLKPPILLFLFRQMFIAFSLWQMLIPLYIMTSLVVMADGIAKMSWCYIITTNCLIYCMADVIVMWQMEWPQGLFIFI